MRARALAVAVAVAALTAHVAAAEVPAPAAANAAADGGLPEAPPVVASPPAAAPAETPRAAPPSQPSYTDQIDPQQLRKLVWRDRGTDRSSPWDRTTAETMSARWRSNLYGFVELNAMHDSTQSYGPSANNAMLARPGTYAAFHGRTQFTANNSLFGFMLKAPDWGRLHTFGQFEVDFFGVQPSDALEQQVYTTPSVRMRLFYFRLRRDFFTRASVDLLVGQYHDLFAWGGAGFYPHSIAFLGVAGEVYHRNPQIRGTLTIPLCCVTLEVAAAAVRPVQRDSEAPDVQGGVKLSLDRWRGVGAQGFGQPDILPLSIGVSGLWRRFAVAEFLPVPGEPKIAFGWGVAVDAFVPVIPARSPIDRKNALSLNAEFTTGSGIADLYTGLTGGALFPTLPNPGNLDPAPLYRPNIDAGMVTFDADGNLKTIDWRAIVVGVQYYLPIADGRIWVSGNYSQLKSNNIVSLTPENSRGGVFYWQAYYDANAYAALTPAAQLGLSYQYTHQFFGDRPFGGAHPESHNHRAELGFRFFF
jgi:hypothetical protein